MISVLEAAFRVEVIDSMLKDLFMTLERWKQSCLLMVVFGRDHCRIFRVCTILGLGNIRYSTTRNT